VSLPRSALRFASSRLLKLILLGALPAGNQIVAIADAHATQPETALRSSTRITPSTPVSATILTAPGLPAIPELSVASIRPAQEVPVSAAQDNTLYRHNGGSEAAPGSRSHLH